MSPDLVVGLCGLLSGSALVIGALVAWSTSISQRVIGAVMAFGAGVLISALSFELDGPSPWKERFPGERDRIPRQSCLVHGS
jgi:zinc transporter ZupT